MKDTSKAILRYLQDHDGENLTADMIGEALELETSKVNGAVTSMAHRHFEGEGDDKVLVPLCERIATGELNDKKREIKYIKATAEGLAFDVDAE